MGSAASPLNSEVRDGVGPLGWWRVGVGGDSGAGEDQRVWAREGKSGLSGRALDGCSLLCCIWAQKEGRREGRGAASSLWNNLQL